RPFVTLAALPVLLGWGPAAAVAQVTPLRPGGVPFNPPVVSPYLNLTRPGNTALNYYNLVRPEFEFRAAYQGLQVQANRQQAEINQVAGEESLPATGHSSSFFNYSHFYPGRGGAGVSRSGTPA